LKFVAHHLWNPAKREAQRKHGMPQDVAESFRQDGLLRGEGPHAPATVRPRLSSWATWHRWRGIEGSFAFPAQPCAPRCGWRFRSPSPEEAARGYARRAGPVARDLRVGPSADTRDVAILMVAFASGGRRRSEAAGLRIEQLREEPSVRFDPADEGSMLMLCLAIQLGRTKTAAADEEGRAFLVGPPVEALREWLQRADLTKGPVFRAIDRWARSRTGR
jgi:integrase